MAEDTISLRFKQIEHQLGDTAVEASSALRLADKHEEQISGEGGLNARYKNLDERMGAMTKALWAFALGIPIGGMMFLVGILALVRPS